MVRNAIKYILIILVVIGIGLVIRNVVNNSKSDSDWQKDEKEKNNYQVTVSLLDKDSEAYIEGAVLTVKTEAGQVLEKWTTTDKEYVITMVPKGKYVLEQISTIDGYILNEDKIEFTVLDKDLKLVMYNESDKEENKTDNRVTNNVPVGDTLSLKNPWSSVIGISVIGFGLLLIIFYKKNIKVKG